jgi:hypothetical protein
MILARSSEAAYKRLNEIASTDMGRADLMGGRNDLVASIGVTDVTELSEAEAATTWINSESSITDNDLFNIVPEQVEPTPEEIERRKSEGARRLEADLQRQKEIDQRAVREAQAETERYNQQIGVNPQLFPPDIVIGRRYLASVALYNRTVTALVKGSVDAMADLPSVAASEVGDCWYIKAARTYMVLAGEPGNFSYQIVLRLAEII